MNEMTKEICKDLAECGLDQTLEYGEHYHYYRKQVKSWTITLYNGGGVYDDYYRIPPLEVMMEFIATEGYGLETSPQRILAYDKFNNISIIDRGSFPNLCIAMYHLIKAIMTNSDE